MKVSIATLCEKVGMSRQNYYKRKKRRTSGKIDQALIRKLVVAERSIQPRLGGRKLYAMLAGRLADGGITMGRDRFFKVLKDEGLLVEPLPRSARTTTAST